MGEDMPYVPFETFPQEIASWTVTREGFALTGRKRPDTPNGQAMGEMRMLERLAAVIILRGGRANKPDKNAMESKAQEIVNAEMPLAPHKRKYLKFAADLLLESNAFIESKALSTYPFHIVELLFKFIHDFTDDGYTPDIVKSKGCAELFNSLLKYTVANSAALGLTLPSFVLEYEAKVNPPLASVSTPPVDDVTAFLASAKLFTPAKTKAAETVDPLPPPPIAGTTPSSVTKPVVDI